MRLPRHFAVAAPVAAALALSLPASATAAPVCPISYGATDNAKPNKLYLYFPSASDTAFPEFGIETVTSPVRFDTSLLTSYSGTAAALQSGVFDVASDDYCELNVQVRQTATAPPTTFARRNTVAIGTDTNVTASGTGYGIVQAVDTGDATAVDFGRVWAGSYQAAAGGVGGALNGVKSTVQRWATAIGGSAAHEAGHGYGLNHTDGTVLATGEDALTRHLMASGGSYTHEQRAGYRRHFSNYELAVLAANVGLSIQTMHNWDLVNPNASAARRFRLTFLSPNATVTQSWAYSGNRSPWGAPTVSGSLGTQVFKGTTYHRHTVTWSTGQAWSGGASGTVPGGASFHVGVTFSGIDFNKPDPIIITDSELLDANGSSLALTPRLPGYDAGTLDSSDGTFDLGLFNLTAATLSVANVKIQEFPAIVSINSLLPGVRPADPFGVRLAPWPKSTTRPLGKRRVAIKPRKGSLSLPVARMAEQRHILTRVPSTCDRGDATYEPDAGNCRPGYAVDLFPATTFVVSFDAIQRKMKHWDRQRRRYVTGDLRQRVFLQVGGRRPDLNRNGRDDAIDIASKRSRDRNRDGVPDDAQRG